MTAIKKYVIEHNSCSDLLYDKYEPESIILAFLTNIEMFEGVFEFVNHELDLNEENKK